MTQAWSPISFWFSRKCLNLILCKINFALTITGIHDPDLEIKCLTLLIWMGKLRGGLPTFFSGGKSFDRSFHIHFPIDIQRQSKLKERLACWSFNHLGLALNSNSKKDRWMQRKGLKLGLTWANIVFAAWYAVHCVCSVLCSAKCCQLSMLRGT